MTKLKKMSVIFVTLLTLGVAAVSSSQADIRFNPYSQSWESSPSDGVLKFNPYSHGWSYERPDSSLEFNPYNHQWNYSR